MILFNCQFCATSLCAEEAQVGQLVRCPTCSATLRVPAQEPAAVGAETGGIGLAPPPLPPPPAPGLNIWAAQGFRPMGRRYGFNCGYCSSRLEATESMAAQEGQCPTCGNQITIPILDRYGRLIDPKTRQIIKQDPHPVHAYAAAGERAPNIERLPQGAQAIRCPRCQSLSPITANNCKTCAMPFTMEGTTAEAAGASNGFCVASLVLGILGLPAGCFLILPVLAIIFGGVGLAQISKGEGAGAGKGLGIAGIVCGVIGALIWLMVMSS